MNIGEAWPMDMQLRAKEAGTVPGAGGSDFTKGLPIIHYGTVSKERSGAAAAAPAHCHHHGRQRPLGPEAGAAPDCRPRRRGGELPPDCQLLPDPGRPVSYRICLFHRELEALPGGGQRHYDPPGPVPGGGAAGHGEEPGAFRVLRRPVQAVAGTAGAVPECGGPLQGVS